MQKSRIASKWDFARVACNKNLINNSGKNGNGIFCSRDPVSFLQTFSIDNVLARAKIIETELSTVFEVQCNEHFGYVLIRVLLKDFEKGPPTYPRGTLPVIQRG